MLTAREWIILPKAEMEARKGELSAQECARLRLELDMIHFTEEEKAQMTEEEKKRFIYSKKETPAESEEFSSKVQWIFRKMQEESTCTCNVIQKR